MPVRALHLVEPGVGERETTRAEHKDAIAAAATEFFPLGGATVLLDAGTTTARIAAQLPTDRELVVVTNSVPIAARLAAMPSVSLQLLGGRVRGLTQAAVGEQTLRVLDTLRVDIAFIGTNAISVRHGLSTPDGDEAAVKRAMVKAANYVVVAADSSKIGREDFVSFAPISSVDTLITDSEISAADREQLTEQRRRGGGRMIVTVTPNPSIDRTVTLTGPLTRGAVHRVSSVTTEPGGKGVNVARALTLAGAGRRGGAARPRHRSAGGRPFSQRGAVQVRADGRGGANQPRHHRTRRHHNETQRTGCRARRRRPRRADPVCERRAPSPQRGWCCPVRFRPVCPTAGTPT